MPKNFKKYILLFLVFFLVFFTIFLFKTDYENSHRKFTFAMLDVGQGDALFVESPTGTQILLDSGPPNKILSELNKVMPIFDRSLDAIMISNPDSDHIGGFSDILKNYKVGMVFEPGTVGDSKIYENFENEIKNKKIPDILAKKGMRLDLGGGAVIDILFPDRDVLSWPTNTGSLMARLSYGETSIMLTGDAPKETEKIVLSENSSKELNSTVLKVGHHGSKNSSSSEFIKAVSPVYSLISVGQNNMYGHPNQETLDTLSQIGSKIFRTDQQGTIILKSDGHMLEWKYER